MPAATRLVVALATRAPAVQRWTPGTRRRTRTDVRTTGTAACSGGRARWFRHSDETVVRRLVRRADCPRATTTTRFASRCRAGWRSSSPARAPTARGRGALQRAREPRGVVEGGLLSSGAKVGDVVKVEADVDLEGISILHVLADTKHRSEPERLELLGSPKPFEPVVTTLATKSRTDRPPRRDRPPRSGDGGGDDARRTRPRREPGGRGDAGPGPRAAPVDTEAAVGRRSDDLRARDASVAASAHAHPSGSAGRLARS